MQNAEIWRENEHILLDPIMAFRPLQRFDVYVTIFHDLLSKEDWNLGSCRLHCAGDIRTA